MGKVTITFDTDNAAFADDEDNDSTQGPAQEIYRILHRIADRVLEGHDGGKALDSNGNTVGSWQVTA